MARATGLGLVLASLTGCWPHEGNHETDRIARTVADAIGYPGQDSAAGFARAAQGTSAGQDSRLAVVGAEDLEADDPTEPIAALVLRVHLEPPDSLFTEDPVTACYRAEFSRYGVVDEPDRVDCPRGAKPLHLPTPTPTREVTIPDGADGAVRATLARLGDRPGVAAVEAAVAEALPAPADDLTTGLRHRPPPVEVAVDGADVGVALREPETRSCLLGARLDREVHVWRPSRAQLQPGELTCDPRTALSLQGTRPPH